MKKISSEISKLEKVMYRKCLMHKAPDTEDTARRWQTDPYSHLKEGFRVLPMPTDLNESVQNALAEWYEIEKIVCNRMNMSHDQFLDEFEKARNDFLKKGKLWEYTIMIMDMKVHGAARNMDWVNLFSWILPYTDTSNSKTYRETGRMITALFYVEMLYKHRDDHEHIDLKRIEARWRIVNESV